MRQALLDAGVAERDVMSTEASAYSDGSTRRQVARFGLTVTVREVARAASCCRQPLLPQATPGE